MSARSTEELIESLAVEARPVAPLAPPIARALATLAGLALAGTALVLAFGDIGSLRLRYSQRESLMLLEMTAMLLTALLAIAAAFMLSVPGRSRHWSLAPIPAFFAWAGLSGLGCYQDLLRLGRGGWGLGHGMSCLSFILVASLLVGGTLLWRLARARPIDPLPVALLGGLGAAALSALLLQFFHPPALTVIDLGVHFLAVAIVVAVTALLRRRALAPA